MLTMTSTLDRVERQFANRTAVIGRDERFSWGEHVARVKRAAGMLRTVGLGRGDTFAIIGLNSHRYTELLHAAYWTGVVPVPINHRLAPPEIRQILDDAGCKLLACSDAFKHLLEVAELTPWRASALFLDESYETRLKETQPAPQHEAKADDLALLLFTGGTTGRSKGVKLTHANIVANAQQVAIAMRAVADDRYLHIAPMFHAADLLGNAFTIVGGSHAYLPSFSGAGVLQAIQELRLTVAMMAPTMIIMTLQERELASYDLASFRLLFYGSSPMDAVWVQRAMQAFKSVALQHSYGLTETSPILTTLDPEDHRRAIAEDRPEILRSAGRAVVGVDLRVVDDDGCEVPRGAVGEVAVRGPNVTAGYLNRPEETKKAIRNGWFHTGDMGRLDETGLLFLVDRKKDVVITGGENVYTSEVEAAIYTHPAVQEAAVIGVPDEKFGEALFAVIVPAPGKTLTPDQLIEHCRSRIGSYKIPRKMDFVSELPKSAMGKILKTELRRIYAGRETKF